MFVIVSARTGRSLGLPAHRDRRAARAAARDLAWALGEALRVVSVERY